ncbi:MAG: EAL domain-containing protein [Rhodocyclaceae bacterium]|nr:EAL domain-containing protein [Rhodocyclaceae bacterium]
MNLPDSISELHEAQIELERMNRLYSMLSHINRSIIRTEDPQELYAAACRIAVEYGGFSAAWISLAEPGSSRVAPVAAAGAASVAELKSIADVVEGRGPTAQVAQDECPLVVNDTRDSTPWQSMTQSWGIRAGGSFPIRLDGRFIGAFNLASAEPGFFRTAEIHLVTEVAADLSFALGVMHKEEKRIAVETKMQYLAYYDSQTGMPSRALFEERLAETCGTVEGKPVTVLVANLRQYHGIVQLLGPAAGIEVIRASAAKLEAALPATVIARVTESKFAIMLPEPEGLDVAEEQAWHIHRILAGPMRAENQEVFLDPFVGIAVFPQDGPPAEVIKHAIVAADAKAHDTNSSCRFYSADLEHGSRRRLDLDAALRRALERDEFVLHYQPQVDLLSGRIVGAEALLRWHRPGHGLVSPQEFIPQLEENGLIVAVGEWVMHEACRRGRQWQDEGLPPFRIAVNLSARQFHDGDIGKTVRRALESSKLDPQWLELELTEGIVLLNADTVIRTMHDLNAEGISHALDDFGTGYSSLSYLQRLPVARIKIDKAFVADIISNPGDAAIARAVVGMAHSLGLSVIAEGVETEGQLGYLRGLGCEEIQGYLFSRPLPEQEFSALMQSGRGIESSPPAQNPDRVLLLIDDEPHILSALNRVLRRDGYRILATTNVNEGFELMAAHPVGVVVCDQRMPDMTGTEFLRRAKELHPDIMRIVLSGYTELNSVIDAVNRGAIYKFITKPWDDEALSESIKDAFRIHGMSHENREMSRTLRELRASALP